MILKQLPKAITACLESINADGTVYWAGNGGSAADSQHMAAELIGRFLKERKAIKSVALSTNTSIVTAVGNDYGYDKIFVRQLEAFASTKDILIAISTSGNSANLIEAMKLCQSVGMKVIALTGKTGGTMKDHCDIHINVNSTDTPRVQEIQLMIEHIICDGIEQSIYANQ